MGRDSNAACLDCRAVYYMGHGPGRTWMDNLAIGVTTVEEFDNAWAADGGAPGAWEQGRNGNVRRFLAEHQGHRVEWWSYDWTSLRDNGDVVIDSIMGEPEQVVCNIAGFRRFEDDEDSPPPGRWRERTGG